MKRIAVLGASRHHEKFGNKAVRAYVRAGWTVIPVNPNADQVEGIDAVPTLSDIARPVDRISVYLHPETTHSLLDEIAAAGADEVWFNPGAADPGVVAAARERSIPVVQACSIVNIGMSPSMFP